MEVSLNLNHAFLITFYFVYCKHVLLDTVGGAWMWQGWGRVIDGAGVGQGYGWGRGGAGLCLVCYVVINKQHKYTPEEILDSLPNRNAYCSHSYRNLSVFSLPAFGPAPCCVICSLFLQCSVFSLCLGFLFIPQSVYVCAYSTPSLNQPACALPWQHATPYGYIVNCFAV